MRDLKIRGYTVGQFPNAPLIVALVAALVGVLVSSGSTADLVARAIFLISLTIWAYEETVGGANGFRRVVGAAGLIYIFISLVRDLG